MKNIKLTIFILLQAANLVAQESDSVKSNNAQVTFLYPIGSSGKSSMNYSNSLSINILYGLNGGLNGLEIGSLMNYNKGLVKGFQLSGVTNINTEYTKGVLLSGLSNICIDSTAGIFISGGLNYSNKNSKGFQLASANIVDNEFRGFQLGVFNFAKKLKGVQLGVFNYLADSDKAVPIGIFSVVKNGNYEFEITGGEVLYSNLNYKMGVEKLYTIFKIGYSSFKNTPIYSFGLGFGSNIPLAEKQIISIDLSYNHIVHHNNWGSKLNFLSKADFNYKYRFTEKVSALVGPSFNFYFTEEKIDGEYGSLKIPYTIYNYEGTSSKSFVWVGFNAGLSLKI